MLDRSTRYPVRTPAKGAHHGLSRLRPKRGYFLSWSGKIARAILKERRFYLFDYARIDNAAAKFENMIACELWRAVTLWT
jgi:hypothetical protein